MSEWRLFPENEPPEWTTPEWYAGRETAPHLEQEGHRERLLLSAQLANEVRLRLRAESTVDLGAGDGGLLSLLTPLGAYWGYDLQETNVTASGARGVRIAYRDVIADWPHTDDFVPEVVLCTEMLEHLVDPHEFVARLYALPEVKAVVASSPYTETDKAHYDFHTWAWDLDGYRALFENAGWKVTAQKTAWISQVLVAERP